MKLSKKLMFGALGLAGILASTNVNTATYKPEVKELREYAIKKYEDNKVGLKDGCNLGIKIFDDRVDDKSIALEVRYCNYDAPQYVLDINISEALNGIGLYTAVSDYGIKGSTLGKNSGIFIQKDDDLKQEMNIWFNDGYDIKTFLRVADGNLEKCEEVNSIMLSKGLCYAGGAHYDQRKKTKPFLSGVYKKRNSNELLNEGRNELKKADKKYKNIINVLVKKFKEGYQLKYDKEENNIKSLKPKGFEI